MKRDFLTTPTRIFFFFLIGVAFLVVLYGADRARKNTANSVVDWLPSGFQETHEFDWFLKHFYEGELLMASWDDCAADDPRLEEISAQLTAPDAQGRPALFWKVMTTTEIAQELSQSPISATPDEAFERMRGWIVSQDGTQGCLLAFFSEEGYKDVAGAIRKLRETMAEIAGVEDSELRVAGTSIEATAIDEASAKSQATLLPLFLLICVSILFAMLRAWKAVFAVFIAAIFNEELSSALIFFCGERADSISLLSSSLLFTLTISGALHLLNYYRVNMATLGRKGAVVLAMKRAAVPCALSCLTTLMGLTSLAFGVIAPIRKFGVFSTLALFIGSFFFFTYISAFVEQYPIVQWLKTDDAKSGSFLTRKLDAFWTRVPDFTIKFAKPLIFVNLAALSFFIWQLPKLQTTITFHGMFPKDARVIQDYDYLEERIGGLTPLELVVNIPTGSNPDARPTDELGLLSVLVDETLNIDGIESALSALNFVPDLPDPNATGFRAVSARAVFDKAFESRLDKLRDGCLFDDRDLPEDREMGIPSARRWRVSLRVFAKAQLDYGQLLEKIRDTTRQTIQEYEVDFGLTDVSTLVTGGVPLAHKAQCQLLIGLTNSYVTAFLLILATLVILLHSLWAGVYAILPNVLPGVFIFGAMAAIGLKIDMGMMMTASVALGISVDSTIHFLTWYRRALGEGSSREEATRFAYRECGTTTTQTAMICGGAMLIFMFSEFLPVARFALMMAALLGLALYGSLIFFPAFLVESTGRYFKPVRVKVVHEENDDAQSIE